MGDCYSLAVRTVLLLAVPLSGIAAPQDIGSTSVGRSAVVTLISSEIAIDGALEEREWKTAPKIGPLTQREPQPGQSDVPGGRGEARRPSGDFLRQTTRRA